MDFIKEPILVPHISGEGEDIEVEAMELQFRYRPHPDRYERIEDPPGWLDTHDKTIISDEVLEPMLDEGQKFEMPDNIPHYYDPPEIEDTNEYIDARREEIDLSLSGESPPQLVEPDRGVLSQLQDEGVTDFIILSVDLVRSTALSTQMKTDRYVRMIQTYMKETTNLFNKFHASILSIQGDGIVAYLSGPNVTGMHDNAIDCAVSFSRMVEEALNEKFSSYGYPKLQYRIGIDTGSPEIVPKGEESYDLLGKTVNIANKIQQAAEPNEILLGEVAERNLHTKWRDNTEKVTEKRNWEYQIDGKLYNIYKYHI